MPFMKATRKALAICDTEFENEHHKNNRENAFRHALWNYSICESCFKKEADIEKVINFSEEITYLHEIMAPNPLLEKEMDLHNNYIGRKVFRENSHISVNSISIFKKMMEEAKPVKNASEIKIAKNHLVYIEE